MNLGGPGQTNPVAGDIIRVYTHAAGKEQQIATLGKMATDGPSDGLGGNVALRNVSGNNTILGTIQAVGGGGNSIIQSDAGSLSTSAIHWRKIVSKTSGSNANNKLRKLLAQGGLRLKPSHCQTVAFWLRAQ